MTVTKEDNIKYDRKEGPDQLDMKEEEVFIESLKISSVTSSNIILGLSFRISAIVATSLFFFRAVWCVGESEEVDTFSDVVYLLGDESSFLSFLTPKSASRLELLR